MSSFKFILLLGTLSHLALACSEGCLLCKDKACVICDNVNHYYKVGDICTNKVVENCIKSFDGEKCQECYPEYYIDFQTQRCVKFTGESPIENCKTYKYENDCISCLEGFYLSDGGCKKVETVIDRCVAYSDPKTCSTCLASMLAEDGKSCLDFPDPNCMSISTIECVQCQDGYTLYKNKYLYDFNFWDANKLKKFDIYNVVNPYYSVCVQENVNNCRIYETFDQCRQCDDGYFRDPDGGCTILPEEPIQFCFEYRTQGICIQCLEGYYLKSESECEPHGLTIALCEQMSMNTKDLCDKCAEGYFLDSNSCVQRRIIVNQCKTLSSGADQCQECEDGYILNKNNTLCLVKIDNCDAYDVTLETATCNSCVTGYYYHVEGRCAKVANTISGCEKYQHNVNFQVINDLAYHCKQCQDKYYMNGSTCEPHDAEIVSTTKCNKFSQTEKNKCESCGDNQVNFDIVNYCAPVEDGNKDANCGSYDAAGECESCIEGYYIINKKCLKITIENCTTASLDGKFCEKCVPSTLENFHVSFETEDNKCNFSHAHIIHDCVETDQIVTNLNSSAKYNTNVCTECITPYYPTTFDTKVKFCVPKSKINFNYGASDNNNNCNIYDPILKVCNECSFNSIDTLKRVVDDDGLCKDSCAVKTAANGSNIPRVVKMNFINTTNSNAPQFFACSDDVLIPNCLIESQEICYKCNDGYWPLVTYENRMLPATYAKYETYDYIPAFEAGHFKTKSVSFDNSYNRVTLFESCKQVDATHFMNHDPSVTNNGDTYGGFILTTNYSESGTLLKKCRFATVRTVEAREYYGCAACKWGTTGHYVEISAGEDKAWFISQCDNMTKCDLGVYYEGVGSHLNDGSISAWLSCHQCMNLEEIPTFSRGIRVGALNGGQPMIATKNFYTQTDCVKPGYSNQNNAFPTNCAVQEVYGDINLTVYDAAALDPTTFNPQCVACKPGYKPVMSTIAATVIMSCEEITNCDSLRGLTMFNKCTYCQEGYVLNDTKDACLKNSIPNCYMGLDETNKKICNECKEGYVPTPNKAICNQVIFNNCLKLKNLRLTNDAELPYTGEGCMECELGYLAFVPNQNQSLCVYSSEIENRVYDNAGVENCRTYASRTDCNQCTVGFIKPNDSNFVCVLTSTITNCEQYDRNKNCRKCKAGYLLSGGKCLDGSEYISNCDEFTSETKCSKCADGFIPVNFGAKTVCYRANNTLLNCNSYNLVQTLTKKLECTSCEPHFYPKTPESVEGLSSCVEIPLIPNCHIYDINTFRCTQCNDGYYIENPVVVSKLQKCLKRTTNTFACMIFDVEKDSCLQCYPGYYVRNKECQFKPTGVIGCAVYLDKDNCSKCKNKQYLLGNTCKPVPENNYIEYCLYYSDEQTCSDCESGYWLRDNACFAILISNCNLLETENECKICQDQFFITPLKTCEKGSVDNCKLHSSQNACQLCDSGYFVNINKSCEQIPEIELISDCLYYVDRNICKQCTNNAILAKDGQTCLTIDKLDASDPLTNEVETNCQGYQYNRDCKICKQGYYFVEGVCTECGGEMTTSCAFCDPKNKSVCHVCQPGYYMNSKGGCIKSALIAESNGSIDTTDGDGDDNEGNGSGTGTTNISIGVIKAIIMFVSLAFLAFF